MHMRKRFDIDRIQGQDRLWRQLVKTVTVSLAAFCLVSVMEAAAASAQPTAPRSISREAAPIQAAAVTEPAPLPKTSVPTTEATIPIQTEAVSTQPVTNFLLIGQNQNLADTMILCCVDPGTRTLTMISFLRDLYLPIPSYEGHPADKNRMNTCYYWGRKWSGEAEGGMALLSQCIEENFEIPVDHCIVVDFEAFAGVIDQIGGVEIELTDREARYLSHRVGYVGTLEPGIQTLSGMEALAYARIRKIDSDIQRTGRQRAVLTAVMKKCREMSPVQLMELAGSVIPMVQSDMSAWDMMGFLFAFLPQWQEYHIRSALCPAQNQDLPGSCWNSRVTIGGTECAVIECNLEKNRAYLKELLSASQEKETAS